MFLFQDKVLKHREKMLLIMRKELFPSQMADSWRLMLTSLSDFILFIQHVWLLCMIYLPDNNCTTSLQAAFSDNILLSSVKCWIITAYFTWNNRQMWPVLNWEFAPMYERLKVNRYTFDCVHSVRVKYLSETFMVMLRTNWVWSGGQDMHGGGGFRYTEWIKDDKF